MLKLETSCEGNQTERLVISATLRIHKKNYVEILGSKKYINKHVCWLKTLYHVSGVLVCVWTRSYFYITEESFLYIIIIMDSG